MWRNFQTPHHPAFSSLDTFWLINISRYSTQNRVPYSWTFESEILGLDSPRDSEVCPGLITFGNVSALRGGYLVHLKSGSRTGEVGKASWGMMAVWNSEEYGRQRAKASVMPCRREGGAEKGYGKGGKSPPFLFLRNRLRMVDTITWHWVEEAVSEVEKWGPNHKGP